MRKTLVNPTLNTRFEDIANGRSNTLAAGLTQLLHDWEHMFKCAAILVLCVTLSLAAHLVYAASCSDVYHPANLTTATCLISSRKCVVCNPVYM
jgi:hypothetical protein